MVRGRARVLRVTARLPSPCSPEWRNWHCVGGNHVSPTCPLLCGWATLFAPGLPAGKAGLRPRRVPIRRRYDRRSGRSGGTGRRAGLKILCPSGRVGSDPTSGISAERGHATAAGGGLSPPGGDARLLHERRGRRGLVGETWFPPRRGAQDSKSCVLRDVWVRIPPPASALSVDTRLPPEAGSARREATHGTSMNGEEKKGARGETWFPPRRGAQDSKSCVLRDVWVRIPPPA